MSRYFSYRRSRPAWKRLRAKKKRFSSALGVICLFCTGVGGIVGGWGGAAIGFVLAGLICVWLEQGKV